MVQAAGDVPPEAMARMTTAEARLYPMAMVDPGRYERATTLVGLVAASCGGAGASTRCWRDGRSCSPRCPAGGRLGCRPGRPGAADVVDAASALVCRQIQAQRAAATWDARIDEARRAGREWLVVEADPTAVMAGVHQAWSCTCPPARRWSARSRPPPRWRRDVPPRARPGRGDASRRATARPRARPGPATGLHRPRAVARCGRAAQGGARRRLLTRRHEYVAMEDRSCRVVNALGHHDSSSDTPAAGPASCSLRARRDTREHLAGRRGPGLLVVELQARGLRVEVPLERRQGGAGPSDSGMLWVGGFPITVPTDNATAAGSPYVLKAEDDGYADLPRRSAAGRARRPSGVHASTTSRTADGIPYWKIGLLHLDSFASTVVQTCSYWGNDDQCRFCGIGVSLDSGRTIVKKSPEQLAEVAMAAKELDGAVDATLTTGSSNGVDRGARYVARCGQAVKEASGPAGRGAVRAADEPRRASTRSPTWASTPSASTSSRSTRRCSRTSRRPRPAPASTSTSAPGSAPSRASARARSPPTSSWAWVRTRSSPCEGCRRAIDIGVFPFVVPIRPVAGSLMEDVVPPDRASTPSASTARWPPT